MCRARALRFVAALTTQLGEIHAPMTRLLDACVEGEGHVNLAQFKAFRTVLLHHIAVEERVLMPALIAALGRPPVFQKALRRDHRSLVSLCVSAPNAEWLDNLRGLLLEHQRLEEEADGFYSLVMRYCRDDASIQAQIERLPLVVVPDEGEGDFAGRLKRVLAEAGLDSP